MPINLANFNNEADISILELGMNKKGETKKMSNICNPDIGLITKISSAHIGNFNSLKDIALAKAEKVSELHQDKYVLGADQMCVYKNKILNKPGNAENAVNSLKLLSGATHYQYSGIAICLNGKSLWSFCDTAILTMKDLSENDIRSYVERDEPYECAGSYKYESHGSELFSEVKGASYTIQGLALTPLLKAFEDLGLSFRN